MNVLNATEMYTLKWLCLGNSLLAQWLGVRAFIAKGPGSIPVGELRTHKPCSTAKKKNV